MAVARKIHDFMVGEEQMLTVAAAAMAVPPALATAQSGSAASALKAGVRNFTANFGDFNIGVEPSEEVFRWIVRRLDEEWRRLGLNPGDVNRVLPP